MCIYALNMYYVLQINDSNSIMDTDLDIRQNALGRQLLPISDVRWMYLSTASSRRRRVVYLRRTCLIRWLILASSL